MQAFLSYSIAETEQYVLTLLAHKLRERGFSLTANYKETIDSLCQLQIGNSTLFIGILTQAGKKTDKVSKEIHFAIKQKKPMILLVEDNIKVADWVERYENTIKFNRKFPQIAIGEVNKRIQTSQDKPQADNTLAWILGGVAALSLITLLSSEKK